MNRFMTTIAATFVISTAFSCTPAHAQNTAYLACLKAWN